MAARIDPPQKATLPAEGPGAIPIGTDRNDNTWYLGGFSDLAPIGASGKEYWTLTDRGPNRDGTCSINGAVTAVKVYPLQASRQRLSK